MSLALSPPVTSYSAPVTMLAASEARKTAAGEMSSGCNQPTLHRHGRCAVVPGLAASDVRSSGPVSPMVSRALFVAGEGRIDEAGNQGVNGDVVLAELHRRRFHQAQDAPFRGGIARSVLGAVLALHGRSRTKSGPSFCVDHLGREGADGVGGAVEVIVDYVAPVQILHSRAASSAGSRRWPQRCRSCRSPARPCRRSGERADVPNVRADGFDATPKRFDHIRTVSSSSSGVAGTAFEAGETFPAMSTQRRRRHWRPFRPRWRVRCRGLRR